MGRREERREGERKERRNDWKNFGEEERQEGKEEEWKERMKERTLKKKNVGMRNGYQRLWVTEVTGKMGVRGASAFVHAASACARVWRHPHIEVKQHNG